MHYSLLFCNWKIGATRTALWDHFYPFPLFCPPQNVYADLLSQRVRWAVSDKLVLSVPEKGENKCFKTFGWRGLAIKYVQFAQGLLQPSYFLNSRSVHPTFHKLKLENPFLKTLFRFIRPQNAILYKRKPSITCLTKPPLVLGNINMCLKKYSNIVLAYKSMQHLHCTFISWGQEGWPDLRNVLVGVPCGAHHRAKVRIRRGKGPDNWKNRQL